MYMRDRRNVDTSENPLKPGERVGKQIWGHTVPNYGVIRAEEQTKNFGEGKWSSIMTTTSSHLAVTTRKLVDSG